MIVGKWTEWEGGGGGGGVVGRIDEIHSMPERKHLQVVDHARAGAVLAAHRYASAHGARTARETEGMMVSSAAVHFLPASCVLAHRRAHPVHVDVADNAHFPLAQVARRQLPLKRSNELARSLSRGGNRARRGGRLRRESRRHRLLVRSNLNRRHHGVRASPRGRRGRGRRGGRPASTGSGRGGN